MNTAQLNEQIIYRQNKLKAAILFNEQDLALNEDGYFSESQKNKLKPKVDLYIWLCIICSFFSFCLALIGFFAGDNSYGFVTFTSIIIAIFGLSFYGIIWSSNLKARLLKGYGVKKVEGRANLQLFYTGKNNEVPNYSLEINQVRFVLDEKTFDAFETTDYRVYYFKLIRNELLSAEALK